MKLLKLYLILLGAVLSLTGCKEGGEGTDTPNPTLTLNVNEIEATEDTNTKVSFPDETKGTSLKIDVWNSTEDEKTGFIKFDDSKIAFGDTIEKAEIRLYVYRVLEAGAVEFHSVNGTWNESSLTLNNSGGLQLTYNSSHTFSESDAGHFIKVDVTDIVKSWASGDQSNDGIALVANPNVEVEFYSKETGDFQPLLIIYSK